ncbi:MAG: hypothetical protein CMJ58_10105 [Planctomycetaceae bacterium]|nr:hypothetical protein [Planctomycetaceae bacterium]
MKTFGLRGWCIKHVPAHCEYFAAQGDMPAAALQLMDQYAYDHGESYDSYLATEDDRAYFWSPQRRGVVGFVRRGRTLNILGGLLAPPQHQGELLAVLMQFAELNRLTINFLMVPPPQAKVFRRHGFHISKCGEELFVRLQRETWQGKHYQWLRRQENAGVRKELRVEEIDPAADPHRYQREIVPQLNEINEQHLAGTLHGRELVFYEGRFTPQELRRRRLFVTWQGDQAVAFVVCNPAMSGDMWAIEIYRRRADAPQGVIPFSMLQIMRQMKDEGVLYASLSSVPFLRCGPPVKNDDLRFQGGCQIFWHGMNWLFDVRGIYHFKSRFRPAYREMSVATYPRSSFRSLFAMVLVWELHRVSPLRLARHVAQYWRARHSRAQLAQPEPRPERKVRELKRVTFPTDSPAVIGPTMPNEQVAAAPMSRRHPPIAPMTADAYEMSEA